MITNNFYLSLRRTKVVDIDKDAHKLPPDWGPFKEYKVADYFCPKEWSNDGIFVSVKENEPLWIDFQLNSPCAVIPSVQRLNPITGEAADLEGGLTKDPKQNYLVLPEQKWLDGYAKEGKVYQFMITKAGESLAVNEYVLPIHMQDSHALGFAFFEPKNPPKPSIEEHPYNALPEHRWTQPMWFSPLHTPQQWINAQQHWVKAQSATNDITRGAVCNDTTRGTVCGSNAEAATYYNNVTTKDIPETSPEVESNDCLYSEGVDHSDVVDILENNSVEAVDDKDLDKASMGMGGRIEQDIETDNNTVEYYKEKPSAILTVYMALPEQFEAIMKRGKRQDASREDRHVHSGDVAGVPVPLIRVDK